MTALNILTVAGWIHPDAEGGSFRFIAELNRALVRRGHRATVFTQQLPGTAASEEAGGVRVLRYPASTSGTAAFYRSTIAAVRAFLAHPPERYDVLHLHHPVSAFAAATVHHGLPCVHTLHIAYFLEYLDRVAPARGGITGGQRLAAAALKAMESYTLRRCRRIAVLSDAVRRQAEEHYRGAAGKLAVIPGGVDLAAFNPSPGRLAAREALGLPRDARLLLTVRRLEPRMGIANLIDAMAAVRAAVPGSLLLVGGRGSLEAELRRHAGEKGLAAAVRFLGFVEERQLPSWYRAADAFVLPTRALEGFGLVTLEALACGVPAVVTPVGASPELAGAVDAGLVAAGAAPQDLADAIIRLLARPDLEQLGRACRAFAERFSWDSTAEQYEALYNQLL